MWITFCQDEEVDKTRSFLNIFQISLLFAILVQWKNTESLRK